MTGEVTIDQRVAVTGDVHLILTDGCSLTVNGGIGLQSGANITIYGQQAGTSTLKAMASDDNAGIGSNESGTCGNITINGGTINASSGYGGAGIGSGYGYAECGHITINGGTINASSGYSGAGIGSGYDYAECGHITINGGTITASSGYIGAGIGSGLFAECGNITISGGIIENAFSEYYGVGIGSGDDGTCGLITISGGTVHALSGQNGDGNAIGNGDDGSGATFSTGTNGNAVIYATLRNSGSQPIVGMNTSSWSGIFFLDNGNGILCGETVTPTDDFEIAEGKSLTVGEGQTLIIPEGVTLTVNGTIENNGTIICYGTIENNGTIICYGTIIHPENIHGNVVVYPQPEPEPTPDPEPSAPSEEEEEVYIPSTPISDGLHDYSLGTMLYVDGKRVRGLYESEGATYFFNEQGFMQTGWVEFAEGWRYFAEDGRMVTGWLQIGNAWYYLDPETGLMFNDGLAIIGKSTYYFYDWGGMASDWWYEDEAGDWYFFGGSGAMKAAQWLEWKGDWYYLTESGRMAVDTEIGGYYVNASGVWAG